MSGSRSDPDHRASSTSSIEFSLVRGRSPQPCRSSDLHLERSPRLYARPGPCAGAPKQRSITRAFVVPDQMQRRQSGSCSPLRLPPTARKLLRCGASAPIATPAKPAKICEHFVRGNCWHTRALS